MMKVRYGGHSKESNRASILCDGRGVRNFSVTAVEQSQSAYRQNSEQIARCTVFRRLPPLLICSLTLHIAFLFFSEKYLDYFTTPYFIFFRDTLSYLTFLGLLFAICLSPSTLAFSRIEWVVLVFFVGRIVTEFKQFMGNTKDVDHQSTATSSDENAWLKRFANYFRCVWQPVSVYKCWPVEHSIVDFCCWYIHQITLKIQLH